MGKSVTHSRIQVKDITYIALFAALMAICAWISIPATVPFTMQTFAVFLAAGLLGGKRGTLTVLLYILIGAVGLPVFSSFKGGVGVLLGTTGGYVVGFIGTALTIWGTTRLFGKKTFPLVLGMVLGLLVCYAFGTAWFMLVYLKNTGPVSLATVLSWCVIPFIAPDLIKLSLALLLTKRLQKHVSI